MSTSRESFIKMAGILNSFPPKDCHSTEEEILEQLDRLTDNYELFRNLITVSRTRRYSRKNI